MDKFKTLNKKTIIAIIAICILAIVAIVGVVAFLEDDGSATAIDEIAQQEPESENANTNASENVEQSPSATENNSDAQGNTSSENTTNNSVMPSESANPTTNTTSQPSTSVAPTTPATGTTTSTTNTNVPNQEYVTSRVEEVERQISEDLAVSWQNLDVAGKFTDVNVEDLGITAVKKAYVIKDKELIPQRAENEDAKTVVPGDEIRYVIEIKNISQEARKEIKVSDSVPAQTSLIDVSNGGTETTVDGVTKIFWTVDFEDGEEVTSVSFIVRVNEDATGTIRNTAVVNGDKTNEIHNTIIKTTKESLVSECTETGELKQVENVSTVHEGDIVSYKITVSNTGETDEKINVEDAIPDGLTLDATSVRINKEDANIIVEDNKISVKDYTLNAGEELLITFNATVNALGENDYVEDDNGNKVCTKVIDANYVVVNDAKAEDPDGPKYVKKPIIETTKVSEIADCTISPKQLTGSTVHEGDIIRYTITVSNAKGSEAGIINLSDELQKGLSISGNVTANLADAQTKIQVSGKTITLTDYKLQAGATLVITFDTVVDDLGTTTNDKGETVKAVSAKLTANKVTVNGIDKEDSNPPTEVKKPNIEISKTSTVADKDYVRVGESFDYIITAKNNGTEKGDAVITDVIPDEFTIDIANIKVDDQVADNSVVVSGNKVEWTITDLAAESSKVLKIRVTVKDINGVKAETTNTATIDNENPSSSTDVDIGKPDIDVTKSSQVVTCNDYGMTGSKIDVVHEGDEIQYTITAENNGVVSDKINVRDELKDKVEFVEGSLTAKVDSKDITGVKAENGVISLDNYELVAGSKLVITFKVRVKTLGLDENGNKTTKATFEANTVNVNGDSTEDPNGPGEIRKPDLKVTKSSSIEAGQYAEIGKQFSYYIVVDNKGDEKGSAVVEDDVPSNLRIDSYGDALAGDTISVVGNKVTWNVNNLPAKTSRRIEIKVTPLLISKGKTEETITNTAKITNGPDSPTDVTIATPVISTTKASEVVVCGQYGMIDSEGATKVTTVHEGDEIEYTITITNSGEVAGIVNMNDSLPAGMTFKGSLTTSLSNVNVVVANDKKSISLSNYSLAGNTTLTITFEVTIDNLGTVKDKDGKDVPATSATLTANTVTVNGVDEKDPNPPTTVKKPNIVIAKTSNVGNRYLNVGETFEYTITATNNGTEVGTAVVTDRLPDGVEYVSYTDNGDTVDVSKLPEIKWTVKDLGVRKSRELKIQVKAKGFTEGVDQSITNKATIDNGNPSSEVTDKVGKPQISANKTSRVAVCGQYGMIDEDGATKVTTVHEGDEIEYTITITNSGEVAGIVNMNDSLPAGMTFKDGSLGTSITGANVIVANDKKSISLTDYSLPAGAKLTITFRVTIDPLGKDSNGNDATSAKLSANTVEVNTVKIPDPNPPTDIKKPIINTAKTSVISECGKGQTSGTTVHEGDKIKYTITVSNSGTEYKNINVSDTLKPGVSLLENTISAKDNGNDIQGITVSTDKRTISLDGYRLEAGHTLTITFEVSVDTLGENITKATIEANQVTVDTTTTPDDKTYEVVKPNINVTKQVLNTENKDINGETVDVRSTLKYVLVGTNTGDEDSNVTITDDIDISKLTDVTVTGAIRTNGTDASTAVIYNKENGKLSWSGLLKKNSGNQVIITIEAKTRNLNESELSYEVENTAHYTPEGSSEKTTNKVTNNVKIMIESDKTATVINNEKDGKAEYGDIIEYTITAENKSDSDGKVNIIDPLPTGVEYSDQLDGKANPIVVKVDGTTVGNGTYNPDNKTISYNGTLKAGAKLTLTFRVKAIETNIENDIVNTATINGIEKSSTVDVVKKISIAATAEVTKSMDLVLVLDVSTSMTENNIGRLDALKTAAKALVNKVFPKGVATDSTVTIIAYSKKATTSPIYKYTAREDALARIDDLQSIEGTNINAGLKATDTLLTGGKLTNKKKVVIFLSDGAPTTPEASRAGIVEKGWADANKYPIYQDDSVENIIESATKVKAHADMIYSIGLGTETIPGPGNKNVGLSEKCAYVTKCNNPYNCTDATHQAMNSVVPFTGVKDKDVWNGGWPTKEYYHYYSERDLAKFVLKTIGKSGYFPVADGADTTATTKNLSDKFDAILKDSSTTHDTAIVTNKPTELQISETATVKGDVVLSIGETSFTINIDTLKNGAYSLGTGDELSYTPGVGFTFTIRNDKTLKKELHIAYTVDKK